MHENYLVQKILLDLKRSKYWAIKLKVSANAGIPDILALKDGLMFFIEVKIEDGKLSEVQKYIKGVIEGKEGKVFVVYGWGDYLIQKKNFLV